MRTILFITILSFYLSAYPQLDKDLAEKAITENLIRSHINFLASDELKGRDTPSKGLNTAAKYLESRFLAYGIEPAPGMESFYQAVPMKKIQPIEEGYLEIDNQKLFIGKSFIYFDGPLSINSTTAIYAGFAGDKDLKNLNIEGKIVLSICGDGKSTNPQEWFTMSKDKQSRIEALGGIGLIELYRSSAIPWNVLTRYFGDEQVVVDYQKKESTTFLRAWANKKALDKINLVNNALPFVLELSAPREIKFTTNNIVGVVKGTDPILANEYVAYSSHYDHIGIGVASSSGDSIYNGARDNAVGVVTVLASAENIAKNPLKRSALFLFFTGEEKGLLGSEYYVENSPVALKKIIYCFNSDNAGYNDTTLVTIFGLNRTTVGDKIKMACEAFGLKAIEDPAPEQGLFDRSDNVNFAKKGIPAPTFSMGFTSFDEKIYKYYHQLEDNPNTLDYDYLIKFFKSYVYSARLIGNMEGTPFWKKGDKYYDAGKKLYGK